MSVVKYKGGCHCGAVKFEVEAATSLEIIDCNCSICAKTGFLHLIVPRADFKLLSGREHLVEYRFNTGIAKHSFCKVCGIKAFYVPRSNPDGMDINVRCLEPFPDKIKIEKFDGQNWEDNAASLAHLSK